MIKCISKYIISLAIYWAIYMAIGMLIVELFNKFNIFLFFVGKSIFIYSVIVYLPFMLGHFFCAFMAGIVAALIYRVKTIWVTGFIFVIFGSFPFSLFSINYDAIGLNIFLYIAINMFVFLLGSFGTYIGNMRYSERK